MYNFVLIHDQTLLSVEGRGPKTSKKYDDTGSDSDIIIEDKRTRWWEGRKDVIHKVKNVCLERYDPGDCEKEEFRFAYVFELNRCGKFVYEGCGAGNNKFKTKEECDETCWVLLAPKENCVDVPGCNGETQKWRFDSTTGTCVSIKNSCSQYHPNRFDNKKGCEETCRKRAIPPRSIAKLLLNELDVSRASIFEEAQINKNNWPSGIIRYYIDEHDYDEVVKTRVRSVLDYLESVTCLQFKRLNSIKRLNHNWLHFTNPDKQMTCNHRPNFDGSGEITVVLGHDCIQKHELLHTILHGLGLKDEVTHPQRDQYVKVMWDNIQPDNRYLFNLDTQQETLFEYDPRSVMHFKDRAYSMNEQPTIIPLLSGLLIQPSKELSQLDKKKLNFMFAKGSVGDLSKPQCFLGK